MIKITIANISSKNLYTPIEIKMLRSYFSVLTKPVAAYIPSKFTARLPSQRRRSSTKQKISPVVRDPKTHRRDLDFIVATVLEAEEITSET
jgi:hypothetical protein